MVSCDWHVMLLVFAVYSDRCFLELPNYVLEGLAMAIESKTSIEQCKCYCIDADQRYGAGCQSIQYYYDSQACLIYKDNRVSHPERFNNAAANGATAIHSYFDYRCSKNGSSLVFRVYIDTFSDQMLHDQSTSCRYVPN